MWVKRLTANTLSQVCAIGIAGLMPVNLIGKLYLLLALDQNNYGRFGLVVVNARG